MDNAISRQRTQFQGTLTINRCSAYLLILQAPHRGRGTRLS